MHMKCDKQISNLIKSSKHNLLVCKDYIFQQPLQYTPKERTVFNNRDKVPTGILLDNNQR